MVSAENCTHAFVHCFDDVNRNNSTLYCIRQHYFFDVITCQYEFSDASECEFFVLKDETK